MNTEKILLNKLHLSRAVFPRLPLYLLTAAISSAMASEVNVTARFLPDSNNPNVNEFENTTPVTGYCKINPAWCKGDQRFSIAIPNRTEETRIPINQSIGLKVPYSWRELQVTHSDGSTQPLKIRIVGVGATLQLYPQVTTITGLDNNGIDDHLKAHNLLWGGATWLYPAGGCSGGSGGRYTNWAYFFFWGFSSNNACTKTARFEVPSIYFGELNIMYELQTPNPLAMSMGLYRGQLTYNLGPNGDFVFGDATATDPNITLNFTLSVQHTLQVIFPPGADQLTLAPQGGWQQWLYNGPRHLPEKLTANQTYQQWSSTRFKMQLQCQYTLGNNCGLQNDAGNTQVAVKTSVTLPNGLLDSSNRPVNRYPLTNNIPSVFQPTRYVNDERATLHFEVDKPNVEQMAASGGRRFRGDVTIVWDSQV